MPWLTIILTLLSFFISKKSGASNTKALLTAGLVGAGTYYVSHETDWGKANLGQLDGVTPEGTGTIVSAATGTTVIDPATGKPVVAGGSNSLGTGIADILKSWGPTGTAAVIGTTAVATSSSLQSYLPWALGLGALLLLMK